MKTADLVALLARDAGPAPVALALRRLLPVALLGLAASALLAAWGLGLVPQAVLAQPAWQFKLAYVLLLTGLGGWLLARVGRPAARRGALSLAVLATLAGMAWLGLRHSLGLPPEARVGDWMGQSWQDCPRHIVMLSLPALAGSLWALRGLAPTAPARAGAWAGLWAGAIGASGYALACGETSPAFIATWYSLGLALTTAAGAVLGARALRW
jgi:hypothetical protein